VVKPLVVIHILRKNKDLLRVRLRGLFAKSLQNTIAQIKLVDLIKLRPTFLLLVIISSMFLLCGQISYASTYGQMGTNSKVYIYYDERYPNVWYGKDTSSVLLKYIGHLLSTFHIDYTVINADNLREITLNEDPVKSILIFAQDVTPDTVWDGSPSSPIIKWLWNGAKIIWTGDWEFYYIGFRNGTLEHRENIENVPFGRPVTVAVEANVSASELGTRYIPSLEKFLTLRPFREDLLKGFEYEVYGNAYVGNARVIDPGLLKVRGGFFIKVGSTGWQLQPIDRAVYIAELLLNRFLNYNLDLTKGSTYFHPYDSGIVYILPSEASTPYWIQVYGAREYFYAYSNVSEYMSSILKDFVVITRSYRFIILVLPLEDTTLFYYNLRRMDSWVRDNGLKILYVFFPKWRYGPEWEYLTIGSRKYSLMVYNMKYLLNLTSTFAIAIWYGWKGRPTNVSEIEKFYFSLPEEIREIYYVWVDQPWVESVVEAGLPRLADRLNLTVVTELYSPVWLALYGSSFKRQIITTGYWDAKSTDEWRASMEKTLNYILFPSNSNLEYRRLGVWIFWDVNDGFGEKYRAYINGVLSNPLLIKLPPQVVMDKGSPIKARADIGSSQPVKLHFSWPDGFTASNIAIVVNGTLYTTDRDGWVVFKTLSEKIAKLTWAPIGARWGPSDLKVQIKTELPSIISDRIKIMGGGTANSRINVGSSTIVWFKAVYEYDGITFDAFKGVLFVNGSAASWNELEKRWEISTGVYEMSGKRSYVISGVGDKAYGITVINDAVGPISVIWYRPAEFKVTDLTVSPTVIQIGGVITISVKVANVGDEEGNYTVRLMINNEVEGSRTVTLAGGESTTVAFTIAERDAGTYSIEVDGLRSAFTVKAAPTWELYAIIAVIALIIMVAASLIVWKRRKIVGDEF